MSLDLPNCIRIAYCSRLNGSWRASITGELPWKLWLWKKLNATACWRIQMNYDEIDVENIVRKMQDLVETDRELANS
jgi:hypothetical protein